MLHVNQAVSNNASTFKPYEPGKAVGDTSPNLAAPQGGGDDCGGLGELIMAVVTVAVAVLAPQALGLVGASTPAWVGAVAGAALGSLAGQVVGNMLGVVDGINWKGVALAALSAGITQGLLPEAMVAGSPVVNAVVRAAVGNALTQGVAVAMGLQSKFDWRGVAASAVGAGVGMAVSEGLGLTVNGQASAALQGGQQLAARALSGFAAGTAAALMRGGKVAIQQVATDAFGNALGESIAGIGSAQTVADNTTLPTGDFSRMDRQNDPYQMGYHDDDGTIVSEAERTPTATAACGTSSVLSRMQ